MTHAKNTVGRGNQSSILNLPKDRIFHVGYPLQFRVGFQEAMQKLAAREISRSNAESRALFQAVAYVRIPIPVLPEPQRTPANYACQVPWTQRALLVASKAFQTHPPLHPTSHFPFVSLPPRTLHHATLCPAVTATPPLHLTPLALTSRNSRPPRFGPR